MEEVKKFLKQTRVNTLTIIGANGFLGKSIIEYAQNKSLSKWGINKIILISRNKFSIKNSKRITIQYKVGDISKIKRLSQSKYIIYAVNSNNNKSNFKAIKNFTHLIKKLSKDTKILFTSSGAVYGKVKDKKEYTRNKILIEKIFKNYAYQGYNVSIARLFTFIGRRILSDKRYAISDFINSGLYKKKILVKSNQIIYRSYMHSDDMVIWLMTILLQSNNRCPIYNVGSDEKIKLQSLAKIIGGILKKPVEIKRITNKKIERYVPTIKKAKKELNLKINYKLRPALYSIIKHQYEKKD